MSHAYRRSPARRERLGTAGLGIGVAVMPAALAGAIAYGKDDVVPDIMHLIRIHAPAERVYGAITTAEGIRQWWTRDAAIEAHVGGVGEFGFNGRRFVAQVVIEELEPTTRVRWRVSNSAWPGNDIEVNLTADNRDTILLFAHRGFPRADQGFASATTRWGCYLFSLKQYLQSGTGTPNPDDGEALG